MEQERGIYVNQKELQSLVEDISLEFFEQSFNHTASFNRRLRTTGGRYLLQTHHLEFNPRVLLQYGMEELIAVIKHELCHYHLHIMGKGYRHRDGDFKELLARTGGARYVKNLQIETEIQNNKVYLCKNCQQKYIRKRKIDTKSYVCGRCKGKLGLIGNE